MQVVKMPPTPETSVGTLIEQAIVVLAFLNQKTGKKFRARNPHGEATANAEIVVHRIKEGYTVQDCKSVIALKCREWRHDEKMSRFLTPSTLFCRTNFEKYLGEIEAEDE